ncbi:2' O-ribose methyltransferase [Saxophila tyrrhenica]|uniref:rRNA methyltransferase 2, mitochondrial n=1 Tax=Saxophila tyrrhenica TaxID=1690608 RepID=A0AAV9P8E0_9PEZI|nr:2' O-ribose methyltransferase [Saxophila tyrrhenica]
MAEEDENGGTEEVVGVIERTRQVGNEEGAGKADSVIDAFGSLTVGGSQKQRDAAEGRVVDVVLSDMMMNASGMPFRDHAGSMDLCNAALTFCYDTLVTGGHFLCKFYQGKEDHALEMRLKRLFEKVHRIKPESSRKESKESYFVCLRRRPDVAREDVFDQPG